MRSCACGSGAPVIDMIGSSAWATKPAAQLNFGSSSTGTPSIRQITATGSGYARSAIRSADPASAMSSSRRSTMVLISGSNDRTTRGANACCASLRSRVWSGGSRNRKPGVFPRGGIAPDSRSCCTTEDFMLSLHESGWRSTSSQAANADSTTMLVPGITNGPCARIRANSG